MMANIIVVGGPISVGKSTLVSSLNYPIINELDENDEVQMILLEHTYKKGRVAPEVIEHFFLQIRKNKYSNHANKEKIHVLDRSIFESLWFAQGNLGGKSLKYFRKLWEKEIKEIIKKSGKPLLYILLTMKWSTFKERLFNRGRTVEIENFKNNEKFFKKHIAEYEKHMTDVFKLFGINYIKIDTDNLSTNQVREIAIKEIKGVINA
ncbi:MAG: deoxynucleoside kinase [Mycoplasmatales bacterium]|nr:deoxynucleoside kinase [Mycoplasmatales bacterium]